jgi:hypothetical protein
VAHNGATLRIREAEGRITLAEQEVLKWESRAKAEHSASLASTHANAEGLAQIITLLEGELAEGRWA